MIEDCTKENGGDKHRRSGQSIFWDHHEPSFPGQGFGRLLLLGRPAAATVDRGKTDFFGHNSPSMTFMLGLKVQTQWRREPPQNPCPG